jgi:hypothetical protein
MRVHGEDIERIYNIPHMQYAQAAPGIGDVIRRNRIEAPIQVKNSKIR